MVEEYIEGVKLSVGKEVEGVNLSVEEEIEGVGLSVEEEVGSWLSFNISFFELLHARLV